MFNLSKEDQKYFTDVAPALYNYTYDSDEVGFSLQRLDNMASARNFRYEIYVGLLSYLRGKKGETLDTKNQSHCELLAIACAAKRGELVSCTFDDRRYALEIIGEVHATHERNLEHEVSSANSNLSYISKASDASLVNDLFSIHKTPPALTVHMKILEKKVEAEKNIAKRELKNLGKGLSAAYVVEMLPEVLDPEHSLVLDGLAKKELISAETYREIKLKISQKDSPATSSSVEINPTDESITVNTTIDISQNTDMSASVEFDKSAFCSSSNAKDIEQNISLDSSDKAKVTQSEVIDEISQTEEGAKYLHGVLAKVKAQRRAEFARFVAHAATFVKKMIAIAGGDDALKGECQELHNRIKRELNIVELKLNFSRLRHDGTANFIMDFRRSLELKLESSISAKEKLGKQCYDEIKKLRKAFTRELKHSNELRTDIDALVARQQYYLSKLKNIRNKKLIPLISEVASFASNYGANPVFKVAAHVVSEALSIFTTLRTRKRQKKMSALNAQLNQTTARLDVFLDRYQGGISELNRLNASLNQSKTFILNNIDAFDPVTFRKMLKKEIEHDETLLAEIGSAIEKKEHKRASKEAEISELNKFPCGRHKNIIASLKKDIKHINNEISRQESEKDRSEEQVKNNKKILKMLERQKPLTDAHFARMKKIEERELFGLSKKQIKILKKQKQDAALHTKYHQQHLEHFAPSRMLRKQILSDLGGFAEELGQLGDNRWLRVVGVISAANTIRDRYITFQEDVLGRFCDQLGECQGDWSTTVKHFGVENIFNDIFSPSLDILTNGLKLLRLLNLITGTGDPVMQALNEVANSLRRDIYCGVSIISTMLNEMKEQLTELKVLHLSATDFMQHAHRELKSFICTVREDVSLTHSSLKQQISKISLWNYRSKIVTKRQELETQAARYLSNINFTNDQHVVIYKIQKIVTQLGVQLKHAQEANLTGVYQVDGAFEGKAFLEMALYPGDYINVIAQAIDDKQTGYTNITLINVYTYVFNNLLRHCSHGNIAPKIQLALQKYIATDSDFNHLKNELLSANKNINDLLSNIVSTTPKAIVKVIERQLLVKALQQLQQLVHHEQKSKAAKVAEKNESILQDYYDTKTQQVLQVLTSFHENSIGSKMFMFGQLLRMPITDSLYETTTDRATRLMLGGKTTSTTSTVITLPMLMLGIWAPGIALGGVLLHAIAQYENSETYSSKRVSDFLFLSSSIEGAFNFGFDFRNGYWKQTSLSSSGNEFPLTFHSILKSASPGDYSVTPSISESPAVEVLELYKGHDNLISTNAYTQEQLENMPDGSLQKKDVTFTRAEYEKLNVEYDTHLLEYKKTFITLVRKKLSKQAAVSASSNTSELPNDAYYENDYLPNLTKDSTLIFSVQDKLMPLLLPNTLLMRLDNSRYMENMKHAEKLDLGVIVKTYDFISTQDHAGNEIYRLLLIYNIQDPVSKELQPCFYYELAQSDALSVNAFSKFAESNGGYETITDLNEFLLFFLYGTPGNILKFPGAGTEDIAGPGLICPACYTFPGIYTVLARTDYGVTYDYEHSEEISLLLTQVASCQSISEIDFETFTKQASAPQQEKAKGVTESQKTKKNDTNIQDAQSSKDEKEIAPAKQPKFKALIISIDPDKTYIMPHYVNVLKNLQELAPKSDEQDFIELRGNTESEFNSLYSQYNQSYFRFMGVIKLCFDLSFIEAVELLDKNFGICSPNLLLKAGEVGVSCFRSVIDYYASLSESRLRGKDLFTLGQLQKPLSKALKSVKEQYNELMFWQRVFSIKSVGNNQRLKTLVPHVGSFPQRELVVDTSYIELQQAVAKQLSAFLAKELMESTVVAKDAWSLLDSPVSQTAGFTPNRFTLNIAGCATKVFEETIPADNDCAFSVLQLTRKKGVELLLAHKKDKDIRRLVAPEIVSQFQADSAPQIMKSKYGEQVSKLLGSINKAQENIDRKVRQINHRLGLKKGKTADQLCDFSKVTVKEKRRLQYYMSAYQMARKALYAHCQSESIFVDFIENYVAVDGAWLAYGHENESNVIDALTKVMKQNYRVWRFVRDNKNPQCVYNCQHDSSYNYIEFLHRGTTDLYATSGQNHFSRLVEAKNVRCSLNTDRAGKTVNHIRGTSADLESSSSSQPQFFPAKNNTSSSTGTKTIDKASRRSDINFTPRPYYIN